MVLLAAAVCNKSGKVIISRQFVEMTRSRIEGLFAAFPKLMNTGKQHTFVETESVRYVYQPLEKLYMLLITTKASNILEDLETLRLFARVVPEYSKVMDESEIIEQAFPLIFAFDEIVALGYRESVNLAQIRTFTEMDSHEEKVYQAVRQTQEREAREQARKMAKELQLARREASRGMGGGRSAGLSGIGSSAMGNRAVTNGTMMDVSPTEPTRPSYTSTSKPSGGGRALKLGSKSKDVESFVDQLRSEGERVQNTDAVNTQSQQNKSSAITKAATPVANQESVHVRVEEKLSVTAGKDGGLQNMEIHGLAFIKVSDEKYGRIQLLLKDNDHKGVQIQPHPNVDKQQFNKSRIIALKNPNKPFPQNQEAGILRWRLQTTDESYLPLSINCWPNEAGSTCDVNIEYDLEMPDMELTDVVISIPVPSGVGAPRVGECDGDYHHDSRKNILEWRLSVIDQDNKTGSLEFSIPGTPDDFFPVTVSFVSKKSYCDIVISDARLIEDNSSVNFSSETLLYVNNYDIV